MMTSIFNHNKLNRNIAERQEGYKSRDIRKKNLIGNGVVIKKSVNARRLRPYNEASGVAFCNIEECRRQIIREISNEFKEVATLPLFADTHNVETYNYRTAFA